MKKTPVVLDLKVNQLSKNMLFTQIHPRVEMYPQPDCTIFNYDIITYFTESGPFIYDFHGGGYIAPDLGGKISDINWGDFLSNLKSVNPKILLIPECYVNGYHNQSKKFFETKVRDLGYFDDRLIVTLQKEQNFYYKEICDKPDWFYSSPLSYKNICYHSIGYNTPTEKEDREKFEKFIFCKQGFLCETFRKLYYLKDQTLDSIVEKIQKTNFTPGKLTFYGSIYTSIRDSVIQAINDSKILSFDFIEYGDESLLDKVTGRNGIGISMDGLVFNTIRDAEFGVCGLPSIKVTRADDYLIEKNNIDMFKCRDVIQIQPNIFTNFDKESVKQKLEEGYTKYMDVGIKDFDRLRKNIRYHFFIILLQKFNNVEFFFFDILMGEKIKEFIDDLDMEVNLNVFEIAADPHNINNNKVEEMQTDYIKELLTKFRQFFKSNYNEWYNSLNI